MRSRVMPGRSPTIARREPMMRLKSVDFPTFGRPMIATTGSGTDGPEISAASAAVSGLPGCTDDSVIQIIARVLCLMAYQTMYSSNATGPQQAAPHLYGLSEATGISPRLYPVHQAACVRLRTLTLPSTHNLNPACRIPATRLSSRHNWEQNSAGHCYYLQLVYSGREAVFRLRQLPKEQGMNRRSATSLAVASLLLLCACTAFSQTPRRIYLAPDDHTDYMWTLDEEGYRQAFVEMLDFYLNQIDATAGNPSPSQARWNCDGSFWLWIYERNKSAADFNRLMSRIRDGHVSSPLTALVVCYGGVPAEAVLRGMYYPGSLERRFRLRFPLAVAMENQTLPYGLGSLWAGAGAKYSWRGICGCATRVSTPGDREHDIYWWGGMDGSRVLMKWNTLFDNTSIGGYAEARDTFGVVGLVDGNATFKSRYPYDVIGAFGRGWDDAKTFTTDFVTAAQQLSTPNRQVFCSNEQDFFQDFEATYGGSLPTVAASFGNEWDLYCASMAEVSARVKRAVEKLRSAEAMATLVSLQNPGFMTDRRAARDQAWMNLGLYWEHDWTANGPVSRQARGDWQRRIAGEIEAYVNKLQTDAATALGGLIKKNGAGTRFQVFNSLSWSRTDVADLPYTDTNPVFVVDLTNNQETPSQIVTVNGQRFLRVLARDVPPVGYKVFEIRPGAGGGFPNAATVSGGVIENDRYRLTVADRGAITGLFDKTRNREFARAVNGRFINDLGPGSGSLQVENAGPVSVTLRADASGPLSHTSRITLVRDKDRIEIRNDITQNFSDVYTWGFGFNLDSPDVWHEEVGAVIRAKLLTQGGHYSPRN